MVCELTRPQLPAAQQPDERTCASVTASVLSEPYFIKHGRKAPRGGGNTALFPSVMDIWFAIDRQTMENIAAFAAQRRLSLRGPAESPASADAPRPASAVADVS